MYIRAQRDLGAAKTSAYYAVAPFVGTFLAFIVNGEKLTHDGKTHTHIITHEHEHSHFISEEKHNHKHKDYINSKEHKLIHEKGL